MTKRTARIFWICVVSVQIAGATMDFIGGNLDDPIRLIGTILLTPGLDVAWGLRDSRVVAPMSAGEYISLLGIAVAINMAIAALIHAFIWAIRGLTKKAA